MTTATCKGCGGVYFPVQPDKSLYFHACPPSTAKADARDENVKSTAEQDAGQIKSIGKGVTLS